MISLSYSLVFLSSYSIDRNVFLIYFQQGTRQYTVLRKTLHLTVEDGSEVSPTDISYVHSVYAPISCRLAQQMIRPGWKGIQDVLGLLPGPTIEMTQALSQGQRARSK